MAVNLDSILGYLEGITKAASLVPGVSGVATLAGEALSIAQAAVKAHEAISGQPLDLSLLKNIDPIQ